MAGWSGDTILAFRSRVRSSLRTDFSLKKKSSLPGGHSHYSLQRTVGGMGALGLAADLPARIVHAFCIHGMMQVHSLCGKSV